MRIAIVAQRFPTLSETFIRQPAVRLLRSGVDVDMWSFVPGTWDGIDASEAALLRDRTFTRAWGPLDLSLHGGLLSSSRRPRALAQLVRKTRELVLGREWAAWGVAALAASRPSVDAVHAHFGPVAQRMARLKKAGLITAPLVVTFHGYDTRMVEQEGLAPFPDLAAHATKIIAISSLGREVLVRAGFEPERVITIPNGVEIPPQDSARAAVNETLRVLLVARLSPEKNIGLLLQAVAKLASREDLPRFECHVVGDGPERGTLVTLAESLGITRSVIWHGQKVHADVLDAHRAADVFVLTSDVEGVPTAMLEAMAAGTLVVCSDVGAVSEAVEHGVTGLLYPSGHVEGLCTALQQALTHADARARMGEAARLLVSERYGIDSQVDALMGLYRSL